ncbi:hypothetical protein ACFL6U_18840 [Planctomycetota bacterium]
MAGEIFHYSSIPNTHLSHHKLPYYVQYFTFFCWMQLPWEWAAAPFFGLWG